VTTLLASWRAASVLSSTNLLGESSLEDFVTKSFVHEIGPAGGVVLAAMDKFRGTASARDLSEAVARVAANHEYVSDVQPMSDGGEGFRDAFEGNVVTVEVPGALGDLVHSRITLRHTTTGVQAVLEVADVVGRHLLTSPTREQAFSADSAGVGHLILMSAALGAASVLIGCGGSSTSDGGLGCYLVLEEAGGLPVPVTAATDVTARFSGLSRYAQQKGVHPDDLGALGQRLDEIRSRYVRDHGVDVELLQRAGASGGIPGALAAQGAQLVSGFDAVVEAVALKERVRRSSLVVTGEGRFDGGSLEGKVTVGMAELVGGVGPLLVLCGSIEADAAQVFAARFPNAKLVSLVNRYGESDAFDHTVACVEAAVGDEIRLVS
jgi:glycerate 2-kinase